MRVGSYNFGLSLAIGSALAYACYDIILRFALGDLNVWWILFTRGCVGVPAVALVARLLGKPLWGAHKRLLVVVVGCLGFISSTCNTIAIASAPLYQAIVILYLYPVFALILAAPLNHEPFKARDGGLVALALAGCLMMIWPDQAAGLTLHPGHFIGLSGSLIFALAAVLARRLGAGNSGLEPMFYYSLFALVFSLPLGRFFGVSLPAEVPTALTIGMLVGLVGITAQVSGFAAFRWLPAYRVGVIGNLEVLGSAVASWLIFHDPWSVRALLGGLIIIFVTTRLKTDRVAASRTEQEPAARKSVD